MIKKQKAFTLSEVMLVLSVIGVIAALTLPGLIQSTQNKQLVTKLKKEYSVLSQAYTSMLADNDSDITPLFSGTSLDFFNAFAGKLSILKNCGVSGGCWYTTPLYNLDGTVNYANLESNAVSIGDSAAVLADGAIVGFQKYSGVCIADFGDGPLDKAVCGLLNVDLNGIAPPNKWGRDYFQFWITKTGLVAKGSFNDGRNCVGGGYGCTAKVLSEGAINY